VNAVVVTSSDRVVNHRPKVHNGFNFNLFKQGKRFRETQIYGKNVKILKDRQPLKNFNLQDIFLLCPQ
jgi:hypothetical protein